MVEYIHTYAHDQKEGRNWVAMVAATPTPAGEATAAATAGPAAGALDKGRGATAATAWTTLEDLLLVEAIHKHGRWARGMNYWAAVEWGFEADLRKFIIIIIIIIISFPVSSFEFSFENGVVHIGVKFGGPEPAEIYCVYICVRWFL